MPAQQSQNTMPSLKWSPNLATKVIGIKINSQYKYFIVILLLECSKYILQLKKGLFVADDVTLFYLLIKKCPLLLLFREKAGTFKGRDSQNADFWLRLENPKEPLHTMRISCLNDSTDYHAADFQSRLESQRSILYNGTACKILIECRDYPFRILIFHPYKGNGSFRAGRDFL